MLKNSSNSTGVAVWFSSGIVPPSGKPCSESPRVISMYFSPSADRGRTMIVESTGSGLIRVSSFRSSFAITDPSSCWTGVILSTTPTRRPPIRTSLPFTRLVATGTSAVRR